MTGDPQMELLCECVIKGGGGEGWKGGDAAELSFPKNTSGAVVRWDWTIDK